MSIDWLQDLERELHRGGEFYACPSLGRSNWSISRSLDALVEVGQRAADHRRMPINIVRLMSMEDAVTGSLFLVPTTINPPTTAGEPSIKWASVETKKAAQDLRDLRFGPSPFFSISVEKILEPVIR